jgi:hypothetical protein
MLRGKLRHVVGLTVIFAAAPDARKEGQGPRRASYAAFRALVAFTLICFGLASARLGI